jgi:ArsR family transcriptional regulator
MDASAPEILSLFKALADPSRLKIVRALMHRELCVCELTQFLELAYSTVSEHLRILAHAGLVEGKKSGTWVNYSLVVAADGGVQASLIELLRREAQMDSEWASDLVRLHEIDRRNIMCIPGRPGVAVN